MRSKSAKRQYWRMGQKSAQKTPSAKLRGSRAMQEGLRRRVVQSSLHFLIRHCMGLYQTYYIPPHGVKNIPRSLWFCCIIWTCTMY